MQFKNRHEQCEFDVRFLGVRRFHFSQNGQGLFFGFLVIIKILVCRRDHSGATLNGSTAAFQQNFRRGPSPTTIQIRTL